jgi:hypothetical protein
MKAERVESWDNFMNRMKNLGGAALLQSRVANSQITMLFDTTSLLEFQFVNVCKII